MKVILLAFDSPPAIHYGGGTKKPVFFTPTGLMNFVAEAKAGGGVFCTGSLSV